MSLVIIALWFLGSFLQLDFVRPRLVVDSIAVITASVTAIFSLVTYIWSSHRAIYQLSLTSYLSLVITSIAVLATTGHTSSPFIALWMLVVVFCGLYGRRGVLAVTLASLGYLTYLILIPSISADQVFVFVLAFVLPIGVSYTIWHRRSMRDTEKDRAYSELVQELSQVSNKSEVVINAIADGVIAIDGQGAIQLINPAAQSIIGWTQQDASELDYRSVLRLTNTHDESLDNENDPIQQTLRTNRTIATDSLTLITHSGKKLLVSLNISSPGQTGSGAIIVFRDITSQVTEERQQAEFISTASHEMRTPVAAIEGYLSLALNPSTGTIDPRARSYLEKAHESAQHLGRLFQDLLDVSKVDDGRLTNNPSVVDVVASARDTTNSLVTIAQQKGLIILFKPDIPEQSAQRITPVFYALIDNDHFRETLTNLIENAIKYTQAGDITVDVEGDEEHVVISISDTGIGIPNEDMSHLFQKFYRVDNSATREIGGTGLGLYLSRRLVETMNGRLWAESEYGKGSKFYIEFDRMTHEEAMRRLDEQTEKLAAARAQAILVPHRPPLQSQPQTSTMTAGSEQVDAVEPSPGQQNQPQA